MKHSQGQVEQRMQQKKVPLHALHILQPDNQLNKLIAEATQWGKTDEKDV